MTIEIAEFYNPPIFNCWPDGAFHGLPHGLIHGSRCHTVYIEDEKYFSVGTHPETIEGAIDALPEIMRRYKSPHRFRIAKDQFEQVGIYRRARKLKEPEHEQALAEGWSVNTELKI